MQMVKCIEWEGSLCLVSQFIIVFYSHNFLFFLNQYFFFLFLLWFLYIILNSKSLGMYRLNIFVLHKSFLHLGCFYIITLLIIKSIYCNIVIYFFMLFNFVIQCWKKKENDQTSCKMESKVSKDMPISPFCLSVCLDLTVGTFHIT